LAFVLLLFCAGGVFGQESGALTPGEVRRISPREAVELAMQSNLSLESQRVSLDTKKRKSDLVWNQFLPTVNVSGTLSRDNWASTSQGVNMTVFPPVPYSITLPQWHAQGQLTASLPFSFALIEGIKNIRLDYAAGQLTFEKYRLQVERDILKLYNNILGLQASAALQRESYANAERQAAAADANYRAGLAPRLTLLQSQVQVENLKPGLYDMDNNIRALQMQFAMTLGLSLDTQFELEPVNEGDYMIPLEAAELISRAASDKPDIRELQAQILTLQSGRKALAMQNYTPFINFNWSLSSMFSPQLDPFKDGFFTMDNWNRGGNFSVTLGMSLNGLLPFTKENQAIKDMDNNI
jgi:outer membrane protein TolC